MLFLLKSSSFELYFYTWQHGYTVDTYCMFNPDSNITTISAGIFIQVVVVSRFQLVRWFCYSKSQSSYISPFTSTFPHCRLNVASWSHGCNCCCETVWRTVTAVLCSFCHNPHAPHLYLTSSHTPESTQWDTTMAFLLRTEAYDVLHTSRSPPRPVIILLKYAACATTAAPVTHLCMSTPMKYCILILHSPPSYPTHAGHQHHRGE